MAKAELNAAKVSFTLRREGRIVNILRQLVICTLGAFSAFAGAQTYPTKPLRLIVPYQTGTAVDVPARGISQALGPLWGQPIVVENRVGANGIIGKPHSGNPQGIDGADKKNIFSDFRAA